MATERPEPGERAGQPPARNERASRELVAPPSARYTTRQADAGESGAAGDSALAGPLVRAVVIGVAGAATLLLVGGVLASTAGLLFVSGVMGAVIGLVLARAAAPSDPTGPQPRSKREITWLAVGLAVAAVVAADIATWLYATSEGGVLGPIDYLLTTFGPLVPAELLFAALAAAWGASAGPVQS